MQSRINQRGTVKFFFLIGLKLFKKTMFVKNEKYEHDGRLNVKIDSVFYGETREPLHLRHMTSDAVKDLGPMYKFYFSHYFT
jgi:hypothetical protein